MKEYKLTEAEEDTIKNLRDVVRAYEPWKAELLLSLAAAEERMHADGECPYTIYHGKSRMERLCARLENWEGAADTILRATLCLLSVCIMALCGAVIFKLMVSIL